MKICTRYCLVGLGSDVRRPVDLGSLKTLHWDRRKVVTGKPLLLHACNSIEFVGWHFENGCNIVLVHAIVKTHV